MGDSKAYLRTEIVEISRRLYNRGLVSGAGGNVSAIVRDSETALITPSGLCKGNLRPDDIVEVDYSGRRVSGGLEPTSELLMHLRVYEVRSDVNAIVHAHPPVSTGFACAGISLNYTAIPEVIAMLGKISFVGYATPTTEELAFKVSKHILEANALLLENHGTITIGSNLEQAYQRVELLEDLAKTTLVAKLLGGLKTLPDSEVKKIGSLETEKYRLKFLKDKKLD